MDKMLYYVEITDNGVIITKEKANGADRIPFEDPATTFVCDDVKAALELSGIILERYAWARVRDANIEMHFHTV